MLRYILFINAFSVILVASLRVVEPGPQYPPTKGEVWPKPQAESKHDTYFKLRPSAFKFTVTGQTCDILTRAIERYTNVLRSTHHIAWRHMRRNSNLVRTNITDPLFKGTIKEININVRNPCETYPQMEMDETYVLTVSDVSTLTSASIWGALRGMESFAQLFYLSDDYKAVFINSTEIQDFPRYPHRGLLLDTARHYITVPNILKTLDAMEMNKMNVLHWHIVDDQSFPYQSEKFPHLSAKGAYHPTMIYTKQNIEQIVNYARDRGIRVLPEFDVPGHTRSWGEAYPNILTKCYQSGQMIGLGPMDPTKNVTFKLIDELFKEVKKRFPENYFHFGGDEVEMNCWQSNPDIMSFMTAHKMTYIAEVHAYFMDHVIPLIGDSKPIVWQEVFDERVNLTKSAIVQVWKSYDAATMIRILKAGHKLIYSTSWYLDQLRNGGDWADFYRADPRQIVHRSDRHVNLDDIVGGEACMWSEVVDDRNVLSRVWPRSSAVAEVLWSAESSYYLAPSPLVYRRLEEHACRMNRRGVNAQPPNGPGFCITG